MGAGQTRTKRGVNTVLSKPAEVGSGNLGLSSKHINYKSSKMSQHALVIMPPKKSRIGKIILGHNPETAPVQSFAVKCSTLITLDDEEMHVVHGILPSHLSAPQKESPIETKPTW
jgi:hypothetical protein